MFKILFFIFFLSCIEPVKIDKAQVLVQEEYDLIKLVNLAKEYYAQDKLALSEIAYRKAIKINPNLPLLYNDLAVIMEKTERVEEAKLLYQQSLKLDARNIVSLRNLAKLNFKLEDYSSAIALLEKTLELVTIYSPEGLKKINNRQWGVRDWKELYQLLSLAYLKEGNIEESICVAKKILSLELSRDIVFQIERFFSSLEYVEQASGVIEQFLSTQPQNASVDLLFDYAVLQYLKASYDKSEQTLASIKISNSYKEIDSRETKSLEILLASKLQQKDVLLEKKRELFEVSTEICKRDYQGNSFRPFVFNKQMALVIKDVCQNERN